MLNSGKKIRDKKNKYSNSCVVRKKNSERNKKPYPPPPPPPRRGATEKKKHLKWNDECQLWTCAQLEIFLYLDHMKMICVHVKGESLYKHSLLLNPIHLVVNNICLKQKLLQFNTAFIWRIHKKIYNSLKSHNISAIHPSIFYQKSI
jgi:hypothetical protein